VGLAALRGGVDLPLHRVPTEVNAAEGAGGDDEV